MDSPAKLSPLFPITRDRGHTIDAGQFRTVGSFQSVEDEMATARVAAVLIDISPRGRFQIEGEATEQIVQEVLGVGGLAIGRGTRTTSAEVYCVRNDLVTVIASAPDDQAMLNKLETAAKSAKALTTITDITDNKAQLWLAGPAAPGILSRLCGLDFFDRSFPNGSCAVTSLAKTTQQIARQDRRVDEDNVLRAYSLIGDRSLSHYLWETILEAGEALGLSPAGWSLYASLSPA